MWAFHERWKAGWIVYGLLWDTSAEDVLMWTGWDSLETMYKLWLTEFVFKCLKGYNVTEFKDLFLQRNSGLRRNENIILPRPETNFIRNSIRFRGAIASNTLTNKETRAKPWKNLNTVLQNLILRKWILKQFEQLKIQISVTNTFNSFNFQLYIFTTFFSYYQHWNIGYRHF